ncbi:MAG: hypothetical protein RR561_07920 [Peptostreptococcus sp.]|uniref:hypothetical protein n=1 Tax=Peptostreptococcus sp. TaxID=1262 RepID=UPI002FCB79F6
MENNYVENKYNTAIGVFWGASFFLGALISILLLFGGNNWIKSILVGACVFLMVGLSIQGFITLFSKK